MRLVFAVAALTLAPLCQAQAPPAAAEDELIGYWSFHQTFFKGADQLTVERSRYGWKGRLKNTGASASNTEQPLLSFGELGRFRGALPADGRTLRGFWIRPGVTRDPRYPGGSSQPFATPLSFVPDGAGKWLASVRPLEDSFTLFLKVFRDEQGALKAAFRDHGQNSNGGATQYRVRRVGDTVHFEAGEPPTAPPQVHMEATVAGPTALRMRWVDLGRDVELARRQQSEVADYFPRAPNREPPSYRKPEQTRDGWKVANAGDAGIDPGALGRLTQRLASYDPSVRGAALIHSVLVAHRGKLVYEEYFHGFDRDKVHDTRSAAKTFSAVLLGAALQRGITIGPESKAFEIMQARGPFANHDPRKQQVTLGHLMTHSAGLACDDNDDNSPGNEGTMQAQARQPDWWKHTLDLPMAHEPGKRYAYCSANINLAGGVLTTATNTWLPELFEQTIARPLKFGEWHWNLQPTDEGYLGGGVFMRPRDLLKIGQLWLDGGTWQGQRLVPEDWVKLAIQSHMRINPQTTGLTPEQFGDFYGEGEDGYAWHLGQVRSGERTFSSYSASGNGGQLLVVVPELELVVVFTGANYRQGYVWGRWPDQIIGGEIIPGMQAAQAKSP